jgi:hypothetical protein
VIFFFSFFKLKFPTTKSEVKGINKYIVVQTIGILILGYVLGNIPPTTQHQAPHLYIPTMSQVKGYKYFVFKTVCMYFIFVFVWEFFFFLGIN